LVAVHGDLQLPEKGVQDIFSAPPPRPLNHLGVVEIKKGVILPTMVVDPKSDRFFAKIAPTCVSKDPVPLLDAAVSDGVDWHVPPLCPVGTRDIVQESTPLKTSHDLHRGDRLAECVM
jgi:hypothetical protein